MSAPQVTAGDALDDSAWFSRSDNRRRRYRVRQVPGGWWIVRRRGGAVFLRAWTPTLPHMPDNDAALRVWWFRVAWPDLDPKIRRSMVADAANNEHPAGRGAS